MLHGDAPRDKGQETRDRRHGNNLGRWLDVKDQRMTVRGMWDDGGLDLLVDCMLCTMSISSKLFEGEERSVRARCQT